MQHIGGGLAFALPLRIIYMSQTLFELALFNNILGGFDKLPKLMVTAITLILIVYRSPGIM